MEENIKKFWQKEITAQERKELLDQLSKENPELYEKLKKQFELRLFNANYPQSVNEEKFAKILKELHDKIKISQTSKTRRLFPTQLYKVAAAVVFILMAAGIWYLAMPKQSDSLDSIDHNLASIENPHTDKFMNFELSDGSQLKLYPNSIIYYSQNYGTENRNLSLSGKAYFKVAKNKELPFIVETATYTTTALGTEFLVDSETENLKIKLYEGSIVVKSTTQSKFQFESVYLKPGEEFKINTKTGIFNHILLNKNNSTSKSSQIEFTQNQDEKSDKIQVLRYRKEHLKIVLDELSKHYGKPIKYQSSEIEGLTFTGEIYLDEKLTGSLKTMCHLNGLIYTENKDEIIIHK